MRSYFALIATVAAIGLPALAHADPPSFSRPEPRQTGLLQSLNSQLASSAAWPEAHTRLAAPSTHTLRAAKGPGFVTRHPVISGLLIGMTAGTAAAAAAWGNEGAFVGFYSGAAAGATLGWALSR